MERSSGRHCCPELWSKKNPAVVCSSSMPAALIIHRKSYRRGVSSIASIDKPKHQPDPNFHFSARINKRYFRDLEKYMIQIEPSIKMFVNIFSWNPYGSKGTQVSRIFPNEHEQDNKIENKRLIPGEEKKYKFIVKYPDEVQDKKYIDQYLIVLATKKNITFLKDYEFKNFQAIIYEIPNNEKRKETIIYDILKN